MIYKCYTIKKNDNYDVKENNNLHTIMLNELKDKFYYLQYKYDYFKCIDKEDEYDIIGNIYTNLLIYE
jgi:hypothetical protein